MYDVPLYVAPTHRLLTLLSSSPGTSLPPHGWGPAILVCGPAATGTPQQAAGDLLQIYNSLRGK